MRQGTGMRFLIGLLVALMLFSITVQAEEPPEDAMPEETTGPMLPEDIPQDGSMLSDSGILRLVNRDLIITKAYVPQDLVVPKVATRKKGMENNIRMRQEAAQALERMFTAAKREEGHVLYAASGYRSYGIQQLLFNGKVEAVGSKQQAQKTVAPPGASEHQLGLAIDIQSPSQLNLNRQFGETIEGQWAASNAHRFGFIMRYKREWTETTGYLYEPWHFRYVGLAHARAIHMLDIPLEHYIAQVAQLPEYVLQGGCDYLLAGLVRDRLAGSASLADLALTDAGEIEQAEALRAATLPYLPAGSSYEAVLWAVYPTPKPTAGPRVDTDEDTQLFSSHHHGLPPQ